MGNSTKNPRIPAVCLEENSGFGCILVLFVEEDASSGHPAIRFRRVGFVRHPDRLLRKLIQSIEVDGVLSWAR